MNSLNLVGRLTRDPELRTLASGTTVCDMRIAVDGAGPDADPLYLDIATFGDQATACQRYLSKGREIAFTGRLIYREWETQDGTKRSRHSATGHVQFLGSRPDNDTSGEQRAPQPVGVGAAGGGGDEEIAF